MSTKDRKELKMKTYVIMLSKNFPAKHPKAGQPTFFRDKVMNAVLRNNEAWQKEHTIRANYLLWEKRIKEVREGKAILSLRQWTDKPYRSKTVEITRLGASDGVGIQILEFDKDRDGMVSWNFFSVDGKYPEVEDLAHNDGLTIEDWKSWFKDYDLTKPMAIIQFTTFRY